MNPGLSFSGRKWPIRRLPSSTIQSPAMASALEKVPSQTDIKATSSPADAPSIQNGSATEAGLVLTHDEYHLATLGYKQEFLRSLGLFESWAATFSSMNFISGIPVLFGCMLFSFPGTCPRVPVMMRDLWLS